MFVSLSINLARIIALPGQARSVLAHEYQRPSLAVLRAVLHHVATLPGALSGLSLCGLFPGGIARFASGVIACMLVAMFNAWVLLVEILRERMCHRFAVCRRGSGTRDSD